MTEYYLNRVIPFGNLRVKACLPLSVARFSCLAASVPRSERRALAFGLARTPLARDRSQSSASAQWLKKRWSKLRLLRLAPQGRTHAAQVEPNNFPMHSGNYPCFSGATLTGQLVQGTLQVSRSVVLHPEATNLILSTSTPEGPLEVLESDAVLLARKGATPIEPTTFTLHSGN
jgi:hypothetical protein